MMRPELRSVADLQAARLAAHYGGRPPRRPSMGGLALWLAAVGAILCALDMALVPIAVPLTFVFAALVLLPWPIARFVLIPLGMPRLTYWLTHLADATFAQDRKGGPAAAAAWALCRQRPRDEETAEWLAAKLNAQGPLGGAGVLASGLLLAARGDVTGARALVRAVSAVDARVCPAAAKRMAASWLAADGAERGAWADVARLGETLGAGGRAAWLLSGIAHALLLEPNAPSELELWLRWALAPRRRSTLPLVRRALEAKRGRFIEAEEDAPIAPAASAAGDDAIRTALSLHAAVMTRGPERLRVEDVRAVGQAWDAALFDRATERHLLERALVLGASTGAAALDRMRAAVEDDLATVVLASGLSLKELDGKSEIAARVRTRLRDRLLSEVEAGADAIKRRADYKRGLPAPDEWREWCSLTAVYERNVASGGEELRRLAFVKVYPDAVSYAVWLYNERHERPLGNAIFRWLLAEATVLDDTRAIGLMTKNVACGV